MHIIQVDNGAFHLTSWLTILENIILLFQPLHSPEVNPIERLWKELKKFLRWQLFSSLDELRLAVRKILARLDEKIIASVIQGRSKKGMGSVGGVGNFFLRTLSPAASALLNS